MYTLENLCRDIGLVPEVTQKVLALNETLNVPTAKLCQKETWEEGLREVTAALGADEDGFGMLTCQLRCALEARADYESKGLSHEIYVATMSCYSRFVGEHLVSYGRYGFDRGFWTVRQLSRTVFRIGELEYELRCDNGQNRINLHIPSNTRLELPLLRASWEQARDVIGRTFPDYRDVPYVCSSWLLSPNLKQLLPEQSRILAFQRNFRVERAFPDEAFREWAFKRRDITNDELPENTSLQRKLKAFVLAGNTFHSGEGTLVEEPFL